MSRLKDVDAIMEFISLSLNEMTKLGIPVDGEYLWELFNTAVDEAPIVDAVEVVRCEDCVYFNKNGFNNGRCGIHNNNFGLPEEVYRDFFCNYGHRRKENE